MNNPYQELEQAFSSMRENEWQTAYDRGLRGDELQNAIYNGMLQNVGCYAEMFGVDEARLTGLFKDMG